MRPELRLRVKREGSALRRAAGQTGHEFLLQDEEENGGRDNGEQRTGEEDAVFLHVQTDVLIQHDRQRQLGLRLHEDLRLMTFNRIQIKLIS